MDIIKQLVLEFKIKEDYIKNIISLIDDGNTIPFIARYRKEMHGSCDDQVLRDIFDRLNYLRNLNKRREEILASIEAQGKLTDEITEAANNALTLSELEDIYRPYKQKRKTRASVAKEKGLEELANIILEQSSEINDLNEISQRFVSDEKGVASTEEALQGASDIIAETVSDSPEGRKLLKEIFIKNAVIKTTGDSEKESVYTMYYDYNEPIAKIPSHRILAINRGEKEDFLKVEIVVDNEKALSILNNLFVKDQNICSEFVKKACEDAYSRLIFPSIEREIRNDLTDKSNEQAIRNFGINLKPLLMQPPLKGKIVLGLDPAYRTGCKICVINRTGKVLATGVIYPTPPHNKIEEAEKVILSLIKKYNVDVISIGNGTASKESEIFVANTIKKADHPVNYMVVNEAGASVYSASKLGAQEFPDYDVSLRSAVSIARRLQDPLAELVKIDPKSIGVGQYQHDIPQARLDESLTGVVESCVNSVGVDLNNASPSLLQYISGISKTIAKNIVDYRDENGIFTSRQELLKVSKLGPKAYEQCAGFLRIHESDNPLDNTAVHPEAYDKAQKLLSLFGFELKDLNGSAIVALPAMIEKYGKEKAASQCGIGVPTMNDIVSELIKPGRDIRDELPAPLLRSDLLSINDLKDGMELTGTVRNVIDFGVFVDIGVHQDGLVHISQITNKYIKHPSEMLKVGDIVKVKILGVDTKKNRISLTMK